MQAQGENRTLSAREQEVLALAAQGKTAREIGAILGITKRTADAHSRSAARKLGATNKTQAVALAVGRGIVNV
jgi:LuxR family quorum sensing-dependent transcriptional regulator